MLIAIAPISLTVIGPLTFTNQFLDPLWTEPLPFVASCSTGSVLDLVIHSGVPSAWEQILSILEEIRTPL